MECTIKAARVTVKKQWEGKTFLVTKKEAEREGKPFTGHCEWN